jgi:hypothetical protein
LIGVNTKSKEKSQSKTDGRSKLLKLRSAKASERPGPSQGIRAEAVLIDHERNHHIGRESSREKSGRLVFACRQSYLGVERRVTTNFLKPGRIFDSD